MPQRGAQEERQEHKQERRRSNCPVACTLDLVGDRWSLLIVRDLLFGKSRYGDLLGSPEKIPTNILAERLKRLERGGVIRRVPYSEHPPRVEYALTDEGERLGKAVDALGEWGLQHFPGTARRQRVQPLGQPVQRTRGAVTDTPHAAP